MNSTPPSTPAAESRCPRCGGGFDCGAARGVCDCFELRLSDALRAELAQRYRGCLCLDCLRQLQQQERAA